jgi:hypothetical protein
MEKGTYRLNIFSARGFARHDFGVCVYISNLREEEQKAVDIGSSLYDRGRLR